jgi:hypothetical protein
MTIRAATFLALSIILMSVPGPAFAQWSTPDLLWQDSWPEAHNLAIDDSATRLVTLIPYAGDGDYSRPLMVTEKIDGVWQTPTVLATNGVYSTAPFQFMPSRSVPVMSGNGETIAYLGYTGSDYAIYISDWLGTLWSTPVPLATGLFSHHYWLSLSANGDVLALCDYPFAETQHLYVTMRSGDVWGPLVRVSSDTGDLGGRFPSLSADGTGVAYVANGRLIYSEYSGGEWSAPTTLTSNNATEFYVDYPQMSGDGASIFYWMVELEDTGSNYVAVAKQLYVVRREGSGWGVPQKVNGESVLPTLDETDGPAAADFHATRLVYTRPAPTEESDGVHIYGSHLEVSEWQGGTTWSESRLVEWDGGLGNYNRFPKLTPDGLHLAYDGGVQGTSPWATYVIWEMTTSTEPPPSPSLIFIDGFELGDTSAWAMP